MSEFHAEASQATASEGLAHGPYVAARAGFDPRPFRLKATNLPMDTDNGYTTPHKIYKYIEIINRIVCICPFICLFVGLSVCLSIGLQSRLQSLILTAGCMPV